MQFFNPSELRLLRASILNDKKIRTYELPIVTQNMCMRSACIAYDVDRM